MKRHLLFLAALLIVNLAASAQKKFSVYAVGFYNQENLFDTCHDEGKKDYEYLPNKGWNGMKYTNKLRNMSKALADMGTDVLPNVGLQRTFPVGVCQHFEHHQFTLVKHTLAFQ